jgi:hypothetical protein
VSHSSKFSFLLGVTNFCPFRMCVIVSAAVALVVAAPATVVSAVSVLIVAAPATIVAAAAVAAVISDQNLPLSGV